MSVQATSAVWKHSKASTTDLIVMLAIADAANAEGLAAHPGREKLVRNCRKSYGSVGRSINRLIAMGELSRVEVGRKGTAAEFDILLPDLRDDFDAKVRADATLKDDSRAALDDTKVRADVHIGARLDAAPSQFPVPSTSSTKKKPKPSPTEKIVQVLIDKTRTHVGKTGDPPRGVYQSAWELTWERCAADEEADPFQGATMVLAAYFEDITGAAPNGQFGALRRLVNQYGAFAFEGVAEALGKEDQERSWYPYARAVAAAKVKEVTG